MATTITAGNATNGIVITPDNTGILELKTGTGAGTTALTLNASQNATVAGTLTVGSTLQVAGVTTNMYPIVSGTAVTTTSGTSADFTNIPSWVKRITVMLAGVSLSTTASALLIRIGSGSFEATGYVGGFGLSNSSAAANAVSYTNGIYAGGFSNAADTINGAISILNVSGNLWVASGTVFRDGTTDAGYTLSSAKTTSGVLDRVQVVLDSTGAFDAGTINIMWE